MKLFSFLSIVVFLGSILAGCQNKAAQEPASSAAPATVSTATAPTPAPAAVKPTPAPTLSPAAVAPAPKPSPSAGTVELKFASPSASPAPAPATPVAVPVIVEPKATPPAARPADNGGASDSGAIIIHFDKQATKPADANAK